MSAACDLNHSKYTVQKIKKMSGKEKKMNNSSKFRKERNNENKKKMKKALRETQTLRALALVRFGHRPPAVTNPQT